MRSSYLPKLDKVLLVVNALLCLLALGLSAGYCIYSDYELAICMFLVALVTGYNVYVSWRSLHRKG